MARRGSRSSGSTRPSVRVAAPDPRWGEPRGPPQDLVDNPLRLPPCMPRTSRPSGTGGQLSDRLRRCARRPRVDPTGHRPCPCPCPAGIPATRRRGATGEQDRGRDRFRNDLGEADIFFTPVANPTANRTPSQVICIAPCSVPCRASPPLLSIAGARTGRTTGGTRGSR